MAVVAIKGWRWEFPNRETFNSSDFFSQDAAFLSMIQIFWDN